MFTSNPKIKQITREIKRLKQARESASVSDDVRIMLTNEINYLRGQREVLSAQR